MVPGEYLTFHTNTWDTYVQKHATDIQPHEQIDIIIIWLTVHVEILRPGSNKAIYNTEKEHVVFYLKNLK